PKLTRLHAGLVKPIADDVIVVAHHGAVQSVTDRPLVPLDIELDARGVPFVDNGAAPLEAVVRHRQERATERVEMNDARGIGMNSNLGSCGPLLGIQGPAFALRVPGWSVVFLWQAPEEAAHVRVIARVGLEDRIVDVPGDLLPRVEDDL